MKLIPKAKPIRIRISAGGEEHSSLDTLLQQYDIESMLSLYKNGSLIRWLNQIGATPVKDKLNSVTIKDFSAVTDKEYADFISIFFTNVGEAFNRIAHYYESKHSAEGVVKWHKLAYEYAYWDSAYELGGIYKGGLYGVEQADDLAFECIKKAAENGVTAAQYDLANLYENGVGVLESLPYAIYWCKKAAEAKFEPAYAALGRLFLTSEEYGEAEKWLKLALDNADPGHPDYTYILKGLGHIYHIMDENDPRSLEYFRKAAILKDPEAMINTGAIYANGWAGVKKDDNQAFYWRKSAAEKGDAEGQFRVGISYEDGSGVHQDINQAIHWYKKAIDQQHTGAMLSLACIYENQGRYSQTYNLIRDAAKANDSDAQYLMGIIYEEGQFSQRKNKNQAIAWYKTAAENGNKDARNRLIELGEPSFSIRLLKVAREVDVGITTIVDFLNRKGYNIKMWNDNTKLDKEMYDLVIKEFKA